MSEYVRSVKLTVEVDTNKDTYRLSLDDLDLEQVVPEVREFIEALPCS